MEMIMRMVYLRELWSGLLQRGWLRRTKRVLKGKKFYLEVALRRRFPSGVVSVRVYCVVISSEQYTATLRFGVYSYGVIVGVDCLGVECRKEQERRRCEWRVIRNGLDERRNKKQG